MHDRYYYISRDGFVHTDIWRDTAFEGCYYSFGNCFKTKEEAEAKLEKIKKLLLEV